MMLQEENKSYKENTRMNPKNTYWEGLVGFDEDVMEASQMDSKFLVSCGFESSSSLLWMFGWFSHIES